VNELRTVADGAIGPVDEYVKRVFMSGKCVKVEKAKNMVI